MLDHTLDELVLAHLKAVPALATLHGCTGLDGADHKLPALTVSTTSESLAGSDTAFRGEVGIIVEGATVSKNVRCSVSKQQPKYRCCNRRVKAESQDVPSSKTICPLVDKWVRGAL